MYADKSRIEDLFFGYVLGDAGWQKKAVVDRGKYFDLFGFSDLYTKLAALIDIPKSIGDETRASGELLRIPIDDVVRSLTRDEPFDDDGLVKAFAVAGRDLKYVERRLLPVAEFADLDPGRISNKEFGRGLVAGLDLVER